MDVKIAIVVIIVVLIPAAFFMWVIVESYDGGVPEPDITAEEAKTLAAFKREASKRKRLSETFNRIKEAADRGDNHLRISGLQDFEKENLEGAGFKITRVSSTYPDYLIEW